MLKFEKHDQEHGGFVELLDTTIYQPLPDAKSAAWILRNRHMLEAVLV